MRRCPPRSRIAPLISRLLVLLHGLLDRHRLAPGCLTGPAGTGHVLHGRAAPPHFISTRAVSGTKALSNRTANVHFLIVQARRVYIDKHWREQAGHGKQEFPKDQGSSARPAIGTWTVIF